MQKVDELGLSIPFWKLRESQGKNLGTDILIMNQYFYNKK